MTMRVGRHPMNFLNIVGVQRQVTTKLHSFRKCQTDSTRDLELVIQLSLQQYRQYSESFCWEVGIKMVNITEKIKEYVYRCIAR